MKLNAFAIVFALVVIPLILVLGYYIELQVNSITLQNQYDTKLLDSAYDAVSAFELNTANEDLSQVSDALRTIIEASNNVFTSTLATNMGMSNASKAYIEPYVPALLYTLYDGYYIYAPTKTTTMCTDSDGVVVTTNTIGVESKGNGLYTYKVVHTSQDSEDTCVECQEEKDNPSAPSGHVKYLEYSSSTYNPNKDYAFITNSGIAYNSSFEFTTDDVEYGSVLYLADNSKIGKSDGETYYTTDVNNAQVSTKNILKSYMPYSARYVGDNFDINIVYTLDNYITVEGTKDKEYLTKSGYLVPLKRNGANVFKFSFNTSLPHDHDFVVADSVTGASVPKFSQDEVQDLIYNSANETAGNFNVYERNFNVNIQIGTDSNPTVIDTSNIKKTYDVLNDELTVYQNYLDKALDEKERANSEGFKDTSGNDNGLNDEIFTQINNFIKYFSGEGNATIDNFEFYTNSTDNPSAVAAFNEEFSTSDINEIKNKITNKSDISAGEDGTKTYESLNNFIKLLNLVISENQYDMDVLSSASYYCKAVIFTNWVVNNLGMIQENQLVAVSDDSYTTRLTADDSDSNLYFDFSESEAKIFDTAGLTGSGQNDSDSITEIDVDSIFYTHKLKVIKNSIQYNLNLTMSAFNGKINGNSKDYLEYSMPVIGDVEWEQILSKVSLVAFMQGLPCGLKTYNNYAIVSSTNNEITVTPEEIFYVRKNDFNDETSSYHRLDCDKLTATDDEIMGFTSKEVKYDKVYDKQQEYYFYMYDHKNLACYDCINDGNYSKTENIFSNSSGNRANLRKAYYIAVGKERNNIYKMNGFKYNSGSKIIYDSESNINPSGTYNLSEIQEIEFVFDTLRTSLASESVLNFKVFINSGGSSSRIDTFYSEIYELPSNSKNYTTVKVKVDPTSNLSASFNFSTDSTTGFKKIGNLDFQNQNVSSTLYAYILETDASGNVVKDADGNNVYKTIKDSNTALAESLRFIRLIYK